MSKERLEIVRSHCNQCLSTTKHFVVAVRSNRDESEPYGPHGECVWWDTTYKMLECCGCTHVSLERIGSFSEWDDHSETEYYPPQISRRTPTWHKELPENWHELLGEIYTALHADSRCLALMGARALIDLYMNEKVGDIGGFKAKLQALEKQSLISKPNKSVLDAALEAGNAAAHRGYKADAVDVSHVMDIVENLLHSYVLLESAEALKSKTPKR